MRPTTPLQHGKRNAYNRGCRCPECTEAVLLASRKRMERIKAEGLTPPEHGASGYTNWGCRCEVCKEAGREANRRTHERVIRGEVQHLRGGILDGCPCDDCKQNIAARRREWYQRKKARA